jgi:hypothetical protein
MKPHIRAPEVPSTKKTLEHGVTGEAAIKPSRGNAVQGICNHLHSRMVILFFLTVILLVPPITAIITGISENQEQEGVSFLAPADQKPAPDCDISAVASGTITFPTISRNDTPGMISRQYTFSFQQTDIAIRSNVSAAVYYGAKNGEKFAIIPQGTVPESVAPDYYRAFIDDQYQDPLYDDLLRSFRLIRSEHRYSDDEYLELMTVFVQSIPYDKGSASQPDTLSRFPVETIVDSTGDCDDKSVLLAGLLSREGYNVSLLLFIPEHHMAVGVSGDRMQYRDTGYIYVETTGVSFIGDVPGKLNESVKYVPEGEEPGTSPLTSPPLIIRVGSGSKKFSSAQETEYILMQKKAVDARIVSLRERLGTTSPENPLQYKALMRIYNEYVKIHNYIVKHEDDRAGTYRYLTSLLSPGISTCIPEGDQGCPGTRSGIETGPAWYLPCPRGIWVPQQCIWQSVRQGFAI